MPDHATTTQTPAFWNGRFDREAYAYGTEPNAFLAAQQDRLPKGGAAFVPADGEGRNGVWLARQGLDVTTLDLSDRGVAKSKALAAKHDVEIDARQGNLFDWAWPVEAFDVVTCIYLHLRPDLRKRLHTRVIEALKPGGLLILEGFTPVQLGHASGGPKDVDMLFTAEMLRTDFARLREVELVEARVELAEGSDHVGPAEVVRGVWRK